MKISIWVAFFVVWCLAVFLMSRYLGKKHELGTEYNEYIQPKPLGTSGEE